MKRTLRSKRGFSLIELLVVLVILALLVGLVAPRFLQQTKRGQRGAAETQIQNFVTAINLYMADMAQPPKDLSDLINPPSSSGGTGTWKGPYLSNIREIPADPWGNPYDYVTPGPNGNDYEITSLGEDGRPGGTGDAADLSSIK